MSIANNMSLFILVFIQDYQCLKLSEFSFLFEKCAKKSKIIVYSIKCLS